MKQETPQWEKEFYERFVTKHYEIDKDLKNNPDYRPWNDDKTGYFDENFVRPTAIKAFIKSTLEELIEKIHECCDGECYHDDCCGKLSCVKAQLRKEFL